MGAKKSKPGDPKAIETQYYTQQVQDRKHNRRIRIIKAVVFVLTLSVLAMLLRDHYQQLILVMGSWGWISALSHQYPPLAYLFFKNPNTPDAMVNLFYAQASGEIQLHDGVGSIINLANPRNSSPTSTVMGYMENNRQTGYADLITYLAQTDPPILPKEDETTALGYVKQAINFITSYILPFGMFGMMAIG